MAEIDRQLWSPQTKLARAAFLESRRGKSAIRVCDRGSEPAGQALEDRPVLSRQSLRRSPTESSLSPARAVRQSSVPLPDLTID